MALLGIDLLRMHNNKAVFAQYKQHQAGFYEILHDKQGEEKTKDADAAGSLIIKAAADGSVTAERKPPSSLDYLELYNLSRKDLRSVAAILATLLMVQRWQMLFPANAKDKLKVTGLEVSCWPGTGIILCGTEIIWSTELHFYYVVHTLHISGTVLSVGRYIAQAPTPSACNSIRW
jgi:hypothetical protein